MRAVNHRVFAVASLCLGLCTCALAQSVPEAPAIAAPLTRPALVAQDTVNAAHTGWMMTSTALVLLMTLPGIALFYAGMVRRADSSADNQYLRQHMQEARNFIKSIDERHKTLLKVATCIVWRVEIHKLDFTQVAFLQ